MVCRATLKASGIRMTTPASKKTVVPITMPVRPSAQPALLWPSLSISVLAIFCAPPLTSRMPPNIEPRPISRAIPFSVWPAPFSTVSEIRCSGIPAPTPITMAAIIMEITGCSLNRMIRANKRIIPTAAAIKSLVGSAAKTTSVMLPAPFPIHSIGCTSSKEF